VTPKEIHANWGVVLPLLKNLESREWNGTYAKLLTGECKLIVVESANGMSLASILTIGKHGGTDGFNTCFIDVLAASKEHHSKAEFNMLIDTICDIAKKNRCDGILADTPNKKLADIAKTFGFKVTPMFKLGRLL